MSEKDLLKFCLENLSYNHLTGKLIWLKQNGRQKAGDLAGSNGTHGSSLGIKGSRYMTHRIIWLMVYGHFPKGLIDHIDHNPINNKLKNIRDVSHQDNLKNMGLKKNNTSGVCGVYYCKERKKWSAFIRVNGIIKALGRDKNFKRAVKLRKTAEVKYGYHINHGRNINGAQ